MCIRDSPYFLLHEDFRMNLSSTTLRSPDILTRSERKDLTRNTLIQSALNLIGQGRSFTSLGIREIAREAGIVPNAFYRHFSTPDELGLALVEEVGITLRRLLREARQAGIAKNEVVRHSVKVYHEYLKQNRLQFLFISSERAGGSRVLRQAIRNDVIHFRNEMAQDFRLLGVYNDMPTDVYKRQVGKWSKVERDIRSSR